MQELRILPLVLGIVAVLTTTACGGAATLTPPQPTEMPTPMANSSSSEPELQTFLASTDLSVGTNRVVFALVDTQGGQTRVPTAQVSTYYLPERGAEGPIEVEEAVFRRWPSGPAGVYTTQLSFDKPGNWGIEVIVVEDGTTRGSQARMEVKDKSTTPAIGAPVPRSKNKISRDVASLEELTTDLSPDPDLYSMTISDAIETKKPLLVVFSTPAFCETATCGPQLEVVEELKDQFQGQANFIHVEVYDNPLEMQGDPSKGRISPTLTEWNLPSEPWTFVVDDEGLLRAKFEGFAPREELEPALLGVLP